MRVFVFLFLSAAVTNRYCMTVPLITMNSASIKPATHQRLGADYLDGEVRLNAAAMLS